LGFGPETEKWPFVGGGRFFGWGCNSIILGPFGVIRGSIAGLDMLEVLRVFIGWYGKVRHWISELTRTMGLLLGMYVSWCWCRPTEKKRSQERLRGALW